MRLLGSAVAALLYEVVRDNRTAVLFVLERQGRQRYDFKRALGRLDEACRADDAPQSAQQGEALELEFHSYLGSIDNPTELVEVLRRSSIIALLRKTVESFDGVPSGQLEIATHHVGELVRGGAEPEAGDSSFNQLISTALAVAINSIAELHEIQDEAGTIFRRYLSDEIGIVDATEQYLFLRANSAADPDERQSLLDKLQSLNDARQVGKSPSNHSACQRFRRMANDKVRPRFKSELARLGIELPGSA